MQANGTQIILMCNFIYLYSVARAQVKNCQINWDNYSPVTSFAEEIPEKIQLSL